MDTNFSVLNLLSTGHIETILYILTGAFAGFSAGLLGVGGGLIIVPVLFFIFSSQAYETQHVMHMALATSLATIIFTSISSTYAHHKRHAVYLGFVAGTVERVSVGGKVLFGRPAQAANFGAGAQN